MPPRLFTWAIVTFWLAMTGWLFYREFLPRFQADKPPAVELSFGDEVRTTVTHWTIYEGQHPIGHDEEEGDRVGSGRTWLKRRPDRTFEYGAEFDFNKGLVVLNQPIDARISKFASAYWVNPKGELRGLRIQMVLFFNPNIKFYEFAAEGKVEGGQFFPVLTTDALGRKTSLSLDPVAVAPGDSFFNPMQPIARGPRLEEGQRWRLRLINPLSKALADFGAKHFPPLSAVLPFVKSRMIEDLDAHVNEGSCPWNGAAFSCWVVDYRKPGEDRILARTWVRRGDQLVLRQEAVFRGRRLTLIRGLDEKHR